MDYLARREVLAFMAACLVGAALVMVAALLSTPPQQSSNVRLECYEYLPHVDDQAPGDFEAWTTTLEPFTNLDYSKGEWLVDGVVVGFSSAEDSAIFSAKECL